MLNYLPYNKFKTLGMRPYKVNFLLGEFNIKVLVNQLNRWKKIATGTSIVLDSGKLITEQIEIVKGSKCITLNNTFGHEHYNNYKMFSLDYFTGDMKVFNGEMTNEKLVFYSINSVSILKNYQKIASATRFKLVYIMTTEYINHLIVARSNDTGKKWIPCLKLIYERK